MTDIEALIARLEKRYRLRQIPDADGKLLNIPDPDCAEAVKVIRALSGAVEAERERCARLVETDDVAIRSAELGVPPLPAESPGRWARRVLAAAIRSSAKDGGK